jgi:hypothetical protein
MHGREAVAAFGVVILIILGAFGLRTQHARSLTCGDFTISGNYAPEGCSPGTTPTSAER